MSKRIVVLQRGWVAVGDYTETENEVQLDNAAIIRRWGTEEGLGELAANGPTKSTVLDPCPIIRTHKLAVVLSMEIVEDKWVR
jgi:hypothetical protein